MERIQTKSTALPFANSEATDIQGYTEGNRDVFETVYLQEVQSTASKKDERMIQRETASFAARQQARADSRGDSRGEGDDSKGLERQQVKHRKKITEPEQTELKKAKFENNNKEQVDWSDFLERSHGHKAQHSQPEESSTKKATQARILPVTEREDLFAMVSFLADSAGFHFSEEEQELLKQGGPLPEALAKKIKQLAQQIQTIEKAFADALGFHFSSYSQSDAVQESSTTPKRGLAQANENTQSTNIQKLATLQQTPSYELSPQLRQALQGYARTGDLSHLQQLDKSQLNPLEVQLLERAVARLESGKSFLYNAQLEQQIQHHMKELGLPKQVQQALLHYAKTGQEHHLTEASHFLTASEQKLSMTDKQRQAIFAMMQTIADLKEGTQKELNINTSHVIKATTSGEANSLEKEPAFYTLTSQGKKRSLADLSGHTQQQPKLSNQEQHEEGQPVNRTSYKQNQVSEFHQALPQTGENKKSTSVAAQASSPMLTGALGLISTADKEQIEQLLEKDIKALPKELQHLLIGLSAAHGSPTQPESLARPAVWKSFAKVAKEVRASIQYQGMYHAGHQEKTDASSSVMEKLAQPLVQLEQLFQQLLEPKSTVAPITVTPQGISTQVGAASSGQFSEQQEAQQLAAAKERLLTPFEQARQQQHYVDLFQTRGVQQVGKEMLSMAKQHQQFVEIRLDPPELGKVRIQLQLSTEQQANVTFFAANHIAREALEQAMPRLKELLEEQGIQLADAEVKDENPGLFQQQEQQENKQKGKESSKIVDSSQGLVTPKDVSSDQNHVPIGQIDYYA